MMFGCYMACKIREQLNLIDFLSAWEEMLLIFIFFADRDQIVFYWDRPNFEKKNISKISLV